MTPRRSPATYAVYPLGEPTLTLPDEVVLDTIFVVEALLENQPQHDECSTFLARLVADGAIVFYNELLELELLETTYRLVLIERYGKSNWRRSRFDGRARSRASRLVSEMVDAWTSALSALNHGVVEVAEVLDVVHRLMARYGLSSYDAAHAATAELLGIRSLITLDTGFAAFPPSTLELYVGSRQVSRCRSLRARGR
jgi:predicted nucleic acid-binding protein